MIMIKPPSHRYAFKPKPVALLVPGWRSLQVFTIDGEKSVRNANRCYDMLERLEDHRLYTSGSLSHFRYVTSACAWQANMWRGRINSMELDDTKVVVRSLGGTLDDAPNSFESLLTATNWLAERRIAPASLSYMGWGLWRSTLTEPVKLSCPPEVGRGALYGGRQSITRPGVFAHMAHADITAAYPHAMAIRPYATVLRKVSNTYPLDAERCGIIRGAISVDPALTYGPVPQRLDTNMIWFPNGGVVQGTWTWREALAAEELGCKVQIDENYAPGIGTERDLFGGEWWDLVKEARGLEAGAAAILKAAVNSTWGQFAMKRSGREVARWDEDGGRAESIIRLELPDGRSSADWTSHIAAETAARVRVRMLMEGCYGDRVPPVYMDTDGGIWRRRALAGMTKEAIPGEWRIKTLMRKCEIRAPQVYRYMCGKGCGVTHDRWHYSVAGVPKGAAEGVFERNRGLSVGLSGTDIVVRAANAQDNEKRDAALLEGAVAEGEW